MALKSYTTEMFYLRCDKCKKESESVNDKILAVDSVCFDGWEINFLGKFYEVLKFLCMECSENEKDNL